MLKKTITYTDYNDVERTEDFYFNLTKAELTEMQASAAGGYDVMLQKIINEKNVPEIMKIFKELLLKAYGEKSADGKYFKKSAEISEAFSQTQAYDELFMDIVQDPEKASEFIKGIIPKNLEKNA